MTPSAPLHAALVDRSPGLTRVALCDTDGVVWEVHLFPDHRPLPGDLWLGRLRARVPGTAAAFVDLGSGPDGFLPAEDMPGGLPPEGSAVLVEIDQDELFPEVEVAEDPQSCNEISAY